MPSLNTNNYGSRMVNSDGLILIFLIFTVPNIKFDQNSGADNVKRISMIRKGKGIEISFYSYLFLIKGAEYFQNCVPILFNQNQIFCFRILFIRNLIHDYLFMESIN